MSSDFFCKNESNINEQIEQTVLKKAGEVLSHKVELTSDFFEEGGTSLAVVGLLISLEEENITVTYEDIYRLRVIKDIAAAATMQDGKEKRLKVIESPFKLRYPDQTVSKTFIQAVDRYSERFVNAKVTETYPLFCDVLELLLPEGNKNSLLVKKYAFSDYYAIVPSEVSLDHLQKALQLLVKNVVSLRTVYNSEQQIVVEKEFSQEIVFDVLQENDINKNGYKYLIEKIASPSSYGANSALSALFIVQQNDGRLAVLIVTHHLFWDLISGEIVTALLEKCLFAPHSLTKTDSLLQYLKTAVDNKANETLEKYISKLQVAKKQYQALIEKTPKKEYFAQVTLDQKRVELLETSPIKFSMDLMLRLILEENPALPKDYVFPVFVNYHNRNEKNRTVVGAVVDYLPIYVSLNSSEAEICEQVEKISIMKGDALIRFHKVIKSDIAHCLPLHSLLIRGWEKGALSIGKIEVNAKRTPVISDYYRLSVKQDKNKLYVKSNSIADTADEFEQILTRVLEQM